MRTHRIGVALVCVVFLAAASGPIAAGQGRRPMPGPEFGTPIPYESWQPWHNVRDSFSPDDPYFEYDEPEGFPGQWHLFNDTPGGGPDANLTGAWVDWTGDGVTIGIVDDGLQRLHPDLSGNYVAGDSYDFGQGDYDPSPYWVSDVHGTAVAGVAAAEGGNATGVTGAAPYAGLAGLRIDMPYQTSEMFEEATEYHSHGENTNIKIKNHSYGVRVPYIDSSGQVDALVTSAAAGTIHVFSAGNYRAEHGVKYIETKPNDPDPEISKVFNPDEDYGYAGDANLVQPKNAPESITVAALAEDGTFASYSNWGANVFVSAPSSGIGGFDITTTDLTGAYGYNGFPAGSDHANYTPLFGGTSSAAPLVAGIMALGKEAYGDMDVRAAKHLLAKTSVMVDPNDVDMRGGWVTNAAGYHFNNNYGFGLIDADAFTSLAELADDGDGVTTLVTQTTGTTEVDDDFGGESGSPTWLSETFVFTTAGQLEDVEVILDITHGWRGDVEAYLTSPGGTTSRLMTRNYYDSFDDIDWTFTSNAFWGEDPVGTWELRVFDTFKDANDGTWNDYEVTANMGTLDLPSEWKLAAGDSYNDSANWTDLSVPNAVDAVANFLEKIEGNATVTVDSPVRVGTINFDNANWSYTIAGPATVTLETSGGDAQINVLAGDHTISARLSVPGGLAVDTAGATTLRLSPTDLVLDADLTKDGDGCLVLTNELAIIGDVDFNAGSLEIASGVAAEVAITGSLTMGAGSTYMCDVVDTEAPVPSDVVSVINGISLTAGPTLSFQIRAMFKAGTYTILQTFGTITGTFGSSSGLGDYVSTPLDYSTPGLLKVTVDADLLGGDSNLDKKVDSDDVSALNQNWLETGKSWGDGDSTFDGKVDSDDVSVLNEKWLETAGGRAGGTGSASYDPATGEILLSGDELCSIGIVSASHLLGEIGAVNWRHSFGTLKEDSRPWRAIESAAGANMPGFEDHLFFTAPAGIPEEKFDLQVRYQALYGSFSFTDVAYGFTELLVVPEPGTLVLLGMGALAGLLFWRRRRAV